MTESDLERILQACRPVPMIMLQCGARSGPQENANAAWAELGKRIGFDAMTVRPIEGKGDRFFTAVPTETESQRKEREAKEASDARQVEIELLKCEIAKLQQKLKDLTL